MTTVSVNINVSNDMTGNKNKQDFVLDENETYNTKPDRIVQLVSK